MKKIVPLSVAALAFGCGGSAQQSSFDSATPTFESVALEITSSDTNSSNFEGTAASDTPDTESPAATDAGAADQCHPHLFVRTHEVVEATNRGLMRILGPLHRLIPFEPLHRDGSTHTWERVIDGVDYKYTVTKNETVPHTFTAQLDVKAAGAADSTFVTIYKASITRDPSAHDGSGTASLDLGPLATLTKESISGTLALNFTVSSTEKKVIFTMNDFTARASVPPRSGHYVFRRVNGTGGTLKFIQDMVLRCTTGTATTTPPTGTTPVTAVARWIDASDGVHFRGDAGATGGQVPNGEKWEGVTCAQGRDPRETFWMMKLEDASGNTVSGQSSQNTAGATGDPCDPMIFGAVPAIDNATTDFKFGDIDFTSDDPLPIPGTTPGA
jgi:hypothetical protein